MEYDHTPAGEAKKVLTRRRYLELADLAEIASPATAGKVSDDRKRPAESEASGEIKSHEGGKESFDSRDPAEYLRKALELPVVDSAEDAEPVPDSREIRLRLARIMEEKGAWQEAADYYRKAIEELREDTAKEGSDGTPDLVFSLARILIAELEQYPEGLEMLERALQSGFSDTGALEKLVSRPDLLDREAVMQVVGNYFPDL